MNLPIIKGNWEVYLPLGFLNSVLIYLVARKYLDVRGSLVSVFAYASSPLIAYYEFSSSVFIPIVTCLFFVGWLLINIPKKLNIYFYPVLLGLLLLILLFLFKVNLITLYSDPGVENGLNQLRGESIKNSYSLESKLIENKYSYFSLHFLFNFINQFSPAVYFTPEYKILGFSFSPPILFAFMILTIIGLVSLIKEFKIFLALLLMFSILILPSALSKNSPDLERLIIAVPLICILAGYGFAQSKNLKPAFAKTLYLTFFILSFFQLVMIIFDIALREPIRLILLKL